MLPQARQLPARDADALHLGCGLEGCGHRRLPPKQGQESLCLQGYQAEARGEV